MRFESEVIADEVLPAIRSILAEELHREYGLTQEEIASRLKVTQPAVSQYLNEARADPEIVEAFRDDPQVQVLLEDAASNAARDMEFLEEIRQAVHTIRDKGVLKEDFEDTERL